MLIQAFQVPNGVDRMEAEWKKAIRRFLLNNLGQMEQEDLESWLTGDLDLAPLLEPPLRVLHEHRDIILAEMHQISPAEIFDSLKAEHPELIFPDNQRAVVRVGKELEALKAFVATL